MIETEHEIRRRLLSHHRYRTYAEVHLKVLQHGPVDKSVVDEWAARVERRPPSYGDVLESVAEHCTPRTFGLWSRQIVERQEWATPHYVTDAIGHAYETATPAQRLYAMFHAFGIETEAISVTLPDLADVTDKHFEHAAATIAASTTKSKIRIGLSALNAQSNYDAARLISARVSVKPLAAPTAPQSGPSSIKSAADSAPGVSVQRPDRPMPKSSTITGPTRPGAFNQSSQRNTPNQIPVPRVAIVLARQIECAEVAAFINTGSRAVLTVDAKYLASELTLHTQWHLVMETPVRVMTDRNGFMLKSATIIPLDNRIKMILHPSDVAQVPEIVSIPRSGRQRHSAKSPTNVAVTILTLLFGDIHSLRTSSTASDISMAMSHAWEKAVSVSAVYRFQHPVRWRTTSRLIESTTKPDPTSKRRPTDVRGSFRWVNGVKYPVKPHRRGS